MKKLGKFLKVWCPALIIMVFIFIMSSFAAADSDKQSGLIVDIIENIFPDTRNIDFLVTLVRKAAHFTEYAILGFLTARGLAIYNKSPWFAIAICAAYSASDEFHQTLVPGRSGELRDILVDTAGATFGTAIFWLTHRTKKSKEAPIKAKTLDA